MARLRFETVRDLCDAFPSAQDELRIEATDEPSLGFLAELSRQVPVDKAVGFCAYLLPRREAVWWGCNSVRSLTPPITVDERAPLQAAEEWVKDPEEERRLNALQIGRESNYRVATTWLALAAGWAGRTMPMGMFAEFAALAQPKENGEWIPISPDQTAKAVRTAILIAAAKVDPKSRTELLLNCVREGARLAEDEPR
jgi:hypothetical protein